MTQLIQIPHQYKEYNGYNFKYINEEELQRAINKVRRDRLKIKDQEKWSEFCEKGLKKNYEPSEKNYYSTDTIINKINNDDIKQYLFENQNEDKFNIENPNIIESTSNKCRSLGYSGITTLTVSSKDADLNKRKKIKSIVDKINSVIIKTRHILEIIKIHVYDFKIPDIPEEIISIQKKATEFCVRFSRNNLYQIELQYSNLLNINNLYLIRKKNRKDEALLLIMLKLNQNILQAYSALQRHMHIIWGYNRIADKLNVLLNFSMKANNIYNLHKDFVDTSLLHPLEDICYEMIESIKCLLNVKHPLEIIKTIKKRYSANSSRPMTLNSVYETKNKRKADVKSALNQNNHKRNIHSATTHNQYYMYHNKTMSKTNLFCKLCNRDLKKGQNVTTYKINQDMNRFGLCNSRQGSYHKNCHSNISKETSNKLRKIKKQFIENKVTDDEKILVIQQKQINDDNKKSVIHKIDESNIVATDDEEIPEEVIEIENIKNDRLDESNCKGEIKNVKLVVISHKSNNNVKVETNDDKIPREIEWDKINRISDKLLNGEIAGVTSEMEAPLEKFIQNELEDFSKFLFSTRIVKN